MNKSMNRREKRKAILQLILWVLLLILTFCVDFAFAFLSFPILLYQWLAKKEIVIFHIRKGSK